MEVLFMLIGEIVFLPFVAFLSVLVEGIVSLTGFVIELCLMGFAGIRFKKRETVKEGAAPAAKPTRATSFRKINRWVLIVFMGGFAVMTCLLILVNTVLFQPALRWGVGWVENRTGIGIEFESAEGSLWRGDLRAKNAKIRRTGHPISNFDIAVSDFAFEFSIGGLLSSPSEIKRVRMAGVSGKFERMGKKDTYRERRRYEITRLLLHDVDIMFVDKTKPEKELILHLVVENHESNPLRSRKGLFDLFFRSNSKGRLNGVAYSIKTENTDRGRNTQWDISEIPVSLVSDFLGCRFVCLREGTAMIHMADSWRMDNSVEIDTQWQFRISNVRAETPENLPGFFRTPISNGLVKFINERSGNLDIKFGLVLNEDRFDGAASLDAAGLFKALSKSFFDSLANAAAQKAGTATEKVKERAKEKVTTGVDRFKDYLNQKRKKSKAEHEQN